MTWTKANSKLILDELLALDWAVHLPIGERVKVDYWIQNNRLIGLVDQWRRIVHGR